MKNILNSWGVSIALLLITTITSCGPTIYKAKSFADSRTKVKTLAILPFNTVIDSKKLQKVSSLETLKESQAKTGHALQEYVYSSFLRKQNDYSVDFQDVDRTNALLSNTGLSYDQLSLKDKSELCALLKVDGVISGKVLMSRPISDGAAVAIGVLTGGFGATNTVNIALTIHDRKSALQWKYDHKTSGSLGSSAEGLAKSLMKKVSKKFPYKS